MAVTLLVCLASASSTATAAPAPPDFLAAWERSDRLLAQNDLIGAAAAIEPLLPRADELDRLSAERIWFDLSAERILALQFRDEEAGVFEAHKLQALADLWVAVRDELVRSSGGQIHAREPVDAAYRQRLAAPQTAGCFDAAKPILIKDLSVPITIGMPGPLPPFEPYSPKEIRKVWAYFSEGLVGGAGGAPSYFGGINKAAYVRSLRKRGSFACNTLLAPKDGAWIPSFGSRVVAIPATEPAVARRVVAANSTIATQAFGLGTVRLQATWTPRVGGGKLQTTAPVSDHRAALPAPRRPGTYTLTVSAGGAVQVRVARLRVAKSPPTSGENRIPRASRSAATDGNLWMVGTPARSEKWSLIKVDTP